MKNGLRKAVALLLAALMLAGVMPAMSLTAFAEDYTVVEVGSQTNVSLSTGSVYLKFTVETTDLYTCRSTGGTYAYAYLYEGAPGGTLVGSDYYSNKGNFIIQNVLEAGKDYCLAVNSYTRPSKYTVGIELTHFSDFSYTDEDITVEPTCSSEGAATEICSYCGNPFTVPVPKKDHTDENNDGVCDVCHETIFFCIADGETLVNSIEPGEEATVRFTCARGGRYYIYDSSSWYERSWFDSDNNGFSPVDGAYLFEAGKDYYFRYTAYDTWPGSISLTVMHEHEDSNDDKKCDICAREYVIKLTDGAAQDITVPAGTYLKIEATPAQNGAYGINAGSERGNFWTMGPFDNNWDYPNYYLVNSYEMNAQTDYFITVANTGEDSETGSAIFTHCHTDEDGDDKCDICQKSAEEYTVFFTDGESAKIDVPAGEFIFASFTPEETMSYNFFCDCWGSCTCDGLYDSNGDYCYSGDELTADETYYFLIHNYGVQTAQAQAMFGHAHVDEDGDGVCDKCEKTIEFTLAENEVKKIDLDPGEEITFFFECTRTGDYMFLSETDNVSRTSLREVGGDYINSNPFYSLTAGKKYYTTFSAGSGSDSYVKAVFTHVHKDANDDLTCDICNKKCFYDLTEGEYKTIPVAAGDTSMAVIRPSADARYRFTCGGITYYTVKDKNWSGVSNYGDGYDMSKSNYYYVVCYNSELKAGRGGIVYTHNHLDANNDKKCDICEKTFVYTITESVPLEITAAPAEMLEIEFDCQTTASYSISTFGEMEIKDVLGEDSSVYTDNWGRYPLTAGEKYVIRIINHGTKAENEGTVLLKHVHTDKNDDYKCDICGLKYRFEVTEDVPVELTVPANDTFELVFTPERTGKYTASTLSGGSFYRGDMNVNSFSDGYNRGSVYYLKEGVTYRYVLYSFRKEHTETVTITHAHSGEETVIVPAGIASDGAASIVCDRCGETFCSTKKPDSNNTKEYEKDGFTFRIYEKNGQKEAKIISCYGDFGDGFEIPDNYEGIPVTAIGNDAFMLAPGVKCVTVPDSVVSIGDEAFIGCADLEKVIIPDSVKVIGADAFTLCSNLKEIRIGTGVEFIGRDVARATLTDEEKTGIEMELEYIEEELNSYAEYVFDYASSVLGTEITSWEQLIEEAENHPELDEDLLAEWKEAKREIEQTERIVEIYIRAGEGGESALEAVVYGGDEAAWQAVVIDPCNDELENAKICYGGERTYTATLIVDGEIWKTIEFSETQESIKLPDVPEKEGYTGTWSDYTLEMKDIEIEAVYKQNIYHATVIADGEIIEVIDFVHGQKSIALPDVPEKEGYTGRWPDYTLGDEDITIEAVYKPNKYTLTYMNGGSAVYSAETAFGDSLTVPRTPQNDGYRFDGWEDEYGNKPGDYASMPAKDLTFTAKWTALEFTITFDTDGAGEIAPFTAAFGTPVPEPVAPAKQGYVFKGWSPEIPATMPAQDLTVTAKWEKDATFDTVLKTGDGQTVDYRATVTITAKAENLPDGYFVVICDSAGHELVKGNNKKATCTVEQMKQSETFTVKIVDENNITQKDGSGAELSKKIEVKVKTGFFDKLIAFFKGLFKILPQVTIEP
ncbi:MAG: InlB B-repeat-containing protein [Clostridia bacterium]|nr:InlB B-repeat-containing protein [Clostridia bacterium]